MTDVTPYPRPPSSKKRKRLTNAEKEAREIFKKCGVPFGYVAHHCIHEQVLRHMGFGEYVYDLRNRLIIPQEVHEQHHSANGPHLTRKDIPHDVLRLSILLDAKLGRDYFGDWLRRNYPE